MGHDISPTPTDEEAAAIVAALTMAWPRPEIAEPEVDRSTAWRFSGRWWNKPRWAR
ncbi:MAG: hypothetical protein ACR2QK_18060 [Acidimicrobiales bacterium]